MKQEAIIVLARVLDVSPGVLGYLDKLSAADLSHLRGAIVAERLRARNEALNTARCPMNLAGGAHEFVGTAPHRVCKGCHVREAV